VSAASAGGWALWAFGGSLDIYSASGGTS